jgi:glycosyltransferase involved in cell wall biosynthesis
VTTPARLPISACVLTLNEEEQLPRCLASLSFCDDIVVVDACSTDRTVEVAGKHTDRVFRRDWAGFPAQRAFAIAQARHDWVLVVDADERVTPALRDAIAAVLADQAGVLGCRIPRRTFYLGRWIDHGDWVPDRVLRFFNRRHARVVGADPHDRIEVRGPVVDLSAPLEHYTFRDLSHHLVTTDAYSRTAAAEMHRSGRRFRWWDLLLRPPFRFFKGYVLKLGLLDGIAGLAVAVGTAHYVFMKYLKLYELERGLDEPPE